MLKTLGLASFCLFGSHPAIAAEPQVDWDLFAVDRQHSLGLRIGHSDTSSWGANVGIMLPGNTELTLDYLESEFRLIGGNENLASYSAHLTTDPLATWSAQLTYQHSGKRSSLGTQDFGVGVQYSRDHWLAAIRYLSGEVDLVTRPNPPTTEPRRFKLKRAAVEAQLDVFSEHWNLAIGYLDFHYERRIRANPNSLLLLRRLGFNTFQQVFGLVDWSASAEVAYQHSNHTWRIGYSQHALELTRESVMSPFVGWDCQLTDTLATSLLAAAGLSDAEHYAELALRYRF